VHGKACSPASYEAVTETLTSCTNRASSRQSRPFSPTSTPAAAASVTREGMVTYAVECSFQTDELELITHVFRLFNLGSDLRFRVGHFTKGAH
jgi:hypothetical protein